MMPSEMKEYCDTLHSFQVKVNVRLKSEANLIVGKVAGIESKHFLLQTETQKDPMCLPYISVANITSV